MIIAHKDGCWWQWQGTVISHRKSHGSPPKHSEVGSKQLSSQSPQSLCEQLCKALDFFKGNEMGKLSSSGRPVDYTSKVAQRRVVSHVLCHLCRVMSCYVVVCDIVWSVNIRWPLVISRVNSVNSVAGNRILFGSFLRFLCFIRPVLERFKIAQEIYAQRTTSGQQVDNKGPKQPQTNLQIVFRHWDGTGMPLFPRYKAQLDAEAKKLCEKYNVSAKSSQVSRNCSLNSLKHLKAFQRLTPR